MAMLSTHSSALPCEAGLVCMLGHQLAWGVVHRLHARGRRFAAHGMRLQ